MTFHQSIRSKTVSTLTLQKSLLPSSSCSSKQQPQQQSKFSIHSKKSADTNQKALTTKPRSLSNFTKLIQRKQIASPKQPQPDRIEYSSTQNSLPFSNSTVSNISSTGSASNSVQSSSITSSFNMRNSSVVSKRSTKNFSSSQRLSRRSANNSSSGRNRSRSRSRSRTNSFSDSRLWGSTGSTFLLRRSNTDEAMWSRILPSLSDNRNHRMRRHRTTGYSGSDFDVEESDLVEIGERLPDRTTRVAREDIFGRRRGDFVENNDTNEEVKAITDGSEITQVDMEDEHDGTIEFESVGEQIYEPIRIGNGSEDDEQLTIEDISQNEDVRMKYEQEETIKTISKAIELSKGKLRKSANMSRAFKAVIKSGEGLIRKSELIHAAMNGSEAKDPSMTILLEPKAMNFIEDGDDSQNDGNRKEPSKKNVEKKSNRKEKRSAQSSSAPSTSPSTPPSSSTKKKQGSDSSEINASTGFSTSMTAKQCAATLETILREMLCKVSRYSHEVHAMRNIIRLKVVHVEKTSKKIERRSRIMITIREEDNIRTSVSFRKLPGFYSSRDIQITPLCLEIRDRFQREWPAVVEALYIRLPTPTKNIPTTV